MNFVLYFFLCFFSLESIAHTSADTSLSFNGNSNTSDTVGLQDLTDKGKALLHLNPDSAKQTLLIALALTTPSSELESRAEILSALSSACYITGDYYDALPYATEAYAIYNALQDVQGLAKCLNNMGLVHQVQEQFSEAKECHIKSIKHAFASADTSLVIRNFNNLALLHSTLKDYDSAIYFINKALHLNTFYENEILAAICHNRKADILFQVQQYDSSILYHKTVLTEFETASNWERCFAFSGLAQNYVAQSKFNTAMPYALESYALANELNAKWDAVRAALLLVDIYKAKEEQGKALDMAMTAMHLKDSLLTERKSKELNYIHLKKSEFDNLQLEIHAAAQAHELERKSMQITIIIMVCVIIVIMMVIVVRQWNEKSELNAMLIHEKDIIKSKNKDLETLNKQKDHILSIIGHDMRSPFSTFKSFITLYRQGLLNKDEQLQFLEGVEKRVASISDTLDNLLYWAYNQMEGIQTSPKSVSLVKIVNSQLSLYEEIAKNKNITFIHEGVESLVFVDEEQCKVIVRNIISNALKFTRISGTIYVRYIHSKHEIGVEVEDQGLGIPEEVLNSLFTFKGQRSHRGTANEKGTGIGLMITKQFIDSNGGRIEVKSVLNEGSIFTVWFPKASSLE
jgi:signal transduction histidine kinase